MPLADSCSPYAGRRGLRARLFAWMNAQSRDTFEEHMAQRKQALLGRLHGAVLEIGPGTGPNLRYFPERVRWTGVEPNVFMHPYLRQTIQTLGKPAGNYRIVPGDASGTRLPADDESVDGVVSTLVLCSVPQPEASLREIRRILKPGGTFVFIEHVAAPRGTGLRTWQNLVQPVWSFLGDGCHPNRETWEMLEAAGFASLEIEQFRYPGAGLVAPLIVGAAHKGPG
jgi:ubiquinone/menaquinone biosynthesis C-methylase UbiE